MRSGVPVPGSEGGAALSSPEDTRRGETRQVSRNNLLWPRDYSHRGDITLHQLHNNIFFYVCVSRANSEIAQVRAKAKQEQAAYQASLRKEQMKVDSLERTLEQKVGQTFSATESWGLKECEMIEQLYLYFCFTEQRDWGVDKDLWRADRQDGEELAAAPHPGQTSEEWLWKRFWNEVHL